MRLFQHIWIMLTGLGALGTVVYAQITNSVKTIFPGFGGSPFYASVLGSTLTAGSGKTVTIPASGSLAPTCRSGRVRVFSADAAASNGSTSQVTKITGTDGTNTVQLFSGDGAATAADVFLDEIFDFVTSYNLTSITVTLTVGTASAKTDVELCYNP